MKFIGHLAAIAALTVAAPALAHGFNWSLDPAASHKVRPAPVDPAAMRILSNDDFEGAPGRGVSEFTMWTIFIVGFSTVGARLRARQSRNVHDS